MLRRDGSARSSGTRPLAQTKNAASKPTTYDSTQTPDVLCGGEAFTAKCPRSFVRRSPPSDPHGRAALRRGGVPRPRQPGAREGAPIPRHSDALICGSLSVSLCSAQPPRPGFSAPSPPSATSSRPPACGPSPDGDLISRLPYPHRSRPSSSRRATRSGPPTSRTSTRTSISSPSLSAPTPSPPCFRSSSP